jgi:putative oxidoreductase
LAYITVFVYMPKAFAWNAPGGGYEYTLFWGLMFLAIWLRGGGPYSVDRLMKRQL